MKTVTFREWYIRYEQCVSFCLVFSVLVDKLKPTVCFPVKL